MTDVEPQARICWSWAETADVLEELHELLETQGWIRGRFFRLADRLGHDGGHCLVGGLNRIRTGVSTIVPHDGICSVFGTSFDHSPIDPLAAVIMRDHPDFVRTTFSKLSKDEISGRSQYLVVQFNDNHSENEVLDTVLQAAKLAREWNDHGPDVA